MPCCARRARVAAFAFRKADAADASSSSSSSSSPSSSSSSFAAPPSSPHSRASRARCASTALLLPLQVAAVPIGCVLESVSQRTHTTNVRMNNPTMSWRLLQAMGYVGLAVVPLVTAGSQDVTVPVLPVLWNAHFRPRV